MHLSSFYSCKIKSSIHSGINQAPFTLTSRIRGIRAINIKLAGFPAPLGCFWYSIKSLICIYFSTFSTSIIICFWIAGCVLLCSSPVGIQPCWRSMLTIRTQQREIQTIRQIYGPASFSPVFFWTSAQFVVCRWGIEWRLPIEGAQIYDSTFITWFRRELANIWTQNTSSSQGEETFNMHQLLQ